MFFFIILTYTYYLTAFAKVWIPNTYGLTLIFSNYEKKNEDWTMKSRRNAKPFLQIPFLAETWIMGEERKGRSHKLSALMARFEQKPAEKPPLQRIGRFPLGILGLGFFPLGFGTFAVSREILCLSDVHVLLVRVKSALTLDFLPECSKKNLCSVFLTYTSCWSTFP